MPSEKDFFELDTQVRLGLDIAMKILPLNAVNSDVQVVALSLAYLPVSELKSIIEIQNKYGEKSKSGKNLNRFQILKQNA